MRRRIEIERFVFQTSQRGRIEVERFIPQHLVFRLGNKCSAKCYYVWIEQSAFANVTYFLRSYRKTELKIRLGIKFCLRYIYPKVHKTENGLLMERSWYVIGPLLVRELYVNVR